MPWIKAIVREVFGLFVDDGSFALSILLWLGFVWLVLPRFKAPLHWNGLILFGGLGLILIESAIRFSRRRQAE
jgi:hypothetical protein